MKRIMGIFIVILFAFIFVKGTFAQPIRGKKFEFSTSASIWNFKEKDGETETIINLPLRIGYFIFRGLEIEPEFLLTIPEDGTGYFILVNLAYNFKASEKVIPFILVGGGYGNGSPIFGVLFDREMGVTALNFGGGIKYLVSNSAAIRIEYRYSKYSGEKTKTGWAGSYTDKLDYTYNNVLVGLSIFF